MEDPRIDGRLLKTHGFERDAFLRDHARIVEGSLRPETSIVRGTIEPPSDVVRMSVRGPEAEKMRAMGEDALRRGLVATVVLNGGMATRFGGVVKGVVEVFDQQTFIALKAEDVRRARNTFGAPLPLVLMNSFSTHETSMAHVRTHDGFGLGREGILSFQQSISLRLNRDGSLFIGSDGKPSYHTPGHGDFFAAIRRSGVLEHLIGQGIEHVLLSNVDNLGATIDPIILGYHIASGCPMTAEVTEKRKDANGQWDRGGAPARVDGRLQIVEGFRFPPDYAQEKLQDFSTNNIIFASSALNRDIPLPRHMVQKKVDDAAAYQLESITGEASGLYEDGRPVLSLHLLRVPRDSLPHGRFYPMKEQSDLVRSRERVRERLRAGWALRDGA